MSRALLFPGQGSQFVGMGKDLFADPAAKRFFDHADSVFPEPLTPILLEGPEETLRQTRYTQPAIFVHSYAAFSVAGRTPDMVAGHSLGEFTALAVAGALSFEEALDLVILRGELMQNAGEVQPGTMAAIIGMEDAAVERICSEVSEGSDSLVVPANYNSPGQLVISGHVDAVHRAMDAAKSQGARMARQIPVGGAFHSPLMDSAIGGLSDRLASATFNAPTCPVYSNVTGTASRDPEVLRDLVLRQLVNPVRWTQTIQSMHRDGASSFLEVGPGTVLKGLVKRILPEATCESFASDR